MRQNLGPWTAALFCACLCVITVVGNLLLAVFTHGGSPAATSVPFYCFLPMCFYFVGAYLSHLQQEQAELRQRFEELASQSPAKTPTP